MLTYRLTDSDLRTLEPIIEEVRRPAASVTDRGLHIDVLLAAQRLPVGLRRVLAEFKLEEPSGALLLRGLPIDDASLGLTPSHWKEVMAKAPLTREEAHLLLVSSLLGDCFAWATQQDGRLLHNLLPIKEHQDEQFGSGSSQPLWWHTEDAFHDYRADYVALLCLRNPDSVATTYADVSRLDLAQEDRRLLFDAEYAIRPDNSHLAEHNDRLTEKTAYADDAFASMASKAEEPPSLSVFFGDPSDPYVRVDPYFMTMPASSRHAAAFDRLRCRVDAAITDVILRPGDLMIIDNYRTVHGRVSFVPRFDGTDRWLKRVNVTRDLRASRDRRRGVAERTIFG